MQTKTSGGRLLKFQKAAVKNSLSCSREPPPKIGKTHPKEEKEKAGKVSEESASRREGIEANSQGFLLREQLARTRWEFGREREEHSTSTRTKGSSVCTGNHGTKGETRYRK